MLKDADTGSVSSPCERRSRLRTRLHLVVLVAICLCCAGCIQLVLAVPVALLLAVNLVVFLIVIPLGLSPELLRYAYSGAFLVAVMLVPSLTRLWSFRSRTGSGDESYRRAVIDSTVSSGVVAIGLLMFNGVRDLWLTVYGAVFTFVLFFVIGVGHYYLEHERQRLARDFEARFPETVQIRDEEYKRNEAYYTRRMSSGIALIVGRQHEPSDERLNQAPPTDDVIALLNHPRSSRLHYVALVVGPIAAAALGCLGYFEGHSPIEADFIAALMLMGVTIFGGVVAQAFTLATTFRLRPTYQMSDADVTDAAVLTSRLRLLLFHNALHDAFVVSAVWLALYELGARDVGTLVAAGVVAGALAVTVILLLIVPFAIGQRATAEELAAYAGADAASVDAMADVLGKSASIVPKSWALKLVVPALSAQGVLPAIASVIKTATK